MLCNVTGGSPEQVLALVDVIASVKREGCAVEVVALGMVLLSGLVLLQEGDRRFIAPHAFCALGDFTNDSKGHRPEELEANSDELELLYNMMIERLSKGSGTTTDKLTQLHEQQWLTPPEALAYGLADTIAVPPPPLQSPEPVPEPLTIKLFGEISQYSVMETILSIDAWDQKNPGQPLTLLINSGGGSVCWGLVLLDYLLSFTNSNPVSTFGLGIVMSMAVSILQAAGAGRRHLAPHTRLMIHQLRDDDPIGSAKSAHIRKRNFKAMDRMIFEILAGRASATAESLRSMCSTHNLYLSASEAVSLGLADDVNLPALH